MVSGLLGKDRMRYWFDTESAVARDDLARPGDHVFDPLPAGLASDPQFEVLLGVVQPIAVDVVDVLAGQEWPTDLLLHHQPMLVNPSTGGITDAAVPAGGHVLAPEAAYASSLTGRPPAWGGHRITPIARGPLVVDVAQALRPDATVALIDGTQGAVRGFGRQPVEVAAAAQPALLVRHGSFAVGGRACVHGVIIPS